MKTKATAPKRRAAKVRRVVSTLGKKKAVKQKQRKTSVGSIAPNLHEGSRSEYLAQYVFSSFGTAVPVPHTIFANLPQATPGEHYLDMVGVTGSIPVVPTIQSPQTARFRHSAK